MKLRAIEITEQGQVTDRYSKAIEQLGSDKGLDVHIGGIYALERIARDSPHDHPTIMEVLAAFVRDHSREQCPRATGTHGTNAPRAATDTPDRTTRPDVQAALTVIGRRDTSRDRLGQIIDLTGANLTRADLGDADLTRVAFTCATLARATLARATLVFVDLTHADLTGADLTGANLSNADLSNADLTGADLSRTDVTAADIRLKRVREKIWAGAEPTDADLSGTDDTGADDTGADFQMTRLTGEKLNGAKLNGAKLGGADLSDANLTGADLTGADLTGTWWSAEFPVPEGWAAGDFAHRLNRANADAGHAGS